MVKTTNNLLGITRDGYKVFDREESHFHTEGGLTPELLKEALSYMYANGVSFKKKTVYFRQVVGVSCCVPITKKDEIVMAYRKGRQGPTPMVKNRTGEPCRSITIIIRREVKLENHYTLITAFVGAENFPEPWDKCLKVGSEEMEKSIAFWNTHALLYDEKLIDHLA